MKARVKIKRAVKEILVKAARSRGVTIDKLIMTQCNTLEKKRKITLQPKGVILFLIVHFNGCNTLLMGVIHPASR